VPVLGLAVGLTREKLKNVLKHHLGSAAWTALVREHAADVVAMLDDHYDAVRLIDEQRHRAYDFGDVLVARAGTRRTATDAGVTAGTSRTRSKRSRGISSSPARPGHGSRMGWADGAM
jgi:hypothetical protein